MQEHGYQQRDLQKITKATSGTTSNWIHGVSLPRGNSVQLLASHFKVEPDWLLNGGLTLQEARQAYNAARGALPLYTYSAIKAERQADEDWLTLGSEIPGAFAVKVEGTAMEGLRGIPAGAVAICDPKRTPTTGDVVLLGHKNARIRRYSCEGEVSHLTADHPGFPAEQMTSEDKIIGVVVGYTVVW